MSARSGMVATTRIFLAPAACAGSSATRAKRTEKRRFMKPSLPVTEAVDVTAHDDRPLQEELVLGPLAGCVEVRVLQAQTLELGRPDREIGRIGVGHPPRMGEVLHPLEENA